MLNLRIWKKRSQKLVCMCMFRNVKHLIRITGCLRAMSPMVHWKGKPIIVLKWCSRIFSGYAFKATAHEKETMMTEANMRYPEMVDDIFLTCHQQYWWIINSHPEWIIQEGMREMLVLFNDHFEPWPSTKKFHVRHRQLGDLEKVCNSLFLDANIYKHFNVVQQRAIKKLFNTKNIHNKPYFEGHGGSS